MIVQRQAMQSRKGATTRKAGVCLDVMRILTVSAVVLAGRPLVAADAAPFRFSKEIQRKDNANEEIVGVTLDPDIYDATRIGLPDIRILDSAGVETPYVIEPVPAATQTFTLIPDLKQDGTAKRTIVALTAKRQPVTSFLLATPDRNFSRRATVEVPRALRTSELRDQGDAPQWQAVGSATISNVQLGKEHRETLTVSFSEQRQPAYRIVIENDDNPPLTITAVTATGPEQRMVFLARADEDYRLVYGSPDVAAPKYDAASVLAGLRQQNPIVAANLGPQQQHTEFEPKPVSSIGRLLNNWYFLGAAICLMVAALAWGLFRAGRRLENLPEEQGS